MNAGFDIAPLTSGVPWSRRAVVGSCANPGFQAYVTLGDTNLPAVVNGASDLSTGLGLARFVRHFTTTVWSGSGGCLRFWPCLALRR